jgi:hypothetical protein
MNTKARRAQWLETAVAGAIVGLALAASVCSANDTPVDLGDLRFEEVMFWENAIGADGRGLYSLPSAPAALSDTLCAADQPCYLFTLDVSQTSAKARLRLGYDTPMRDDNFQLTVTDPKGVVTTRSNGNQYSVEMFFDKPAVGTWTLKLVPYSAEDAPFRLRAKLEAAPFDPVAQLEKNPTWDGRLLPNLRVTRQWEFGFAAPLNPLNGLFPPDDINPPLSAAGQEPISCAPDEMANDGSTRCLRYSFGLANIGNGVFDVRWIGSQTETENHGMVQCIQHADGTTEKHGAGWGEFHTTHGHWHYNDIIYHELFKVVRGTNPPKLVTTGNGKKLGYSPADQAMPEWYGFVQERSGTSGSAGNCLPGSTNRLGMSRGWGDTYRYQRPGNYVSFGVNADGEYVVQTIVDPLNGIVETRDDDNTSYAHLMITGNEVKVLETGLGKSPWDPKKQIYVDWWTE